MITRGQRVKCTNHNGEHTGTVAAIIIPGVGVAVSWDGYIASPTPRSPEARAMKALSKAHNLAMTPVAELTTA